jgi:hypothetical protein
VCIGLRNFTKAHLLQLGQAYCRPGKVNAADQLELVIESLKPRDGFEPPPPAFQGYLPILARGYGISGCC